mmetsp:Transcript_115522/g.337956  ORF Transcript_115522/g.337956 Transcript_115522/m.337956 type:complete len:1040 (-) Transcript_115522:178-3297(-)
MASASFLSSVADAMAPMWVETSFLVFFVLGFTFLRLDVFTRSKKSRKLEDFGDAQFDPKLKKVIETESASGTPASVLKAWRAGRDLAPTPFDLLKTVVQAFMDVEPLVATEELVAHVQRHALVLKNAKTAAGILNIVARSGNAEVLLQLWSAFQTTLEISPTYAMYETLLGGFAALGDEKKVKELLQELLSRSLKLTPRGFAVIIKGFLKNSMVDAVLEQLLSMKKHDFLIPSFAVAQFVRIASDAGRSLEIYDTLLRADMTLPPEAVSTLLEDAYKRSDFDLAKRVEKAAREAKTPFHSSAYDSLLKLYTIKGDIYAIELFKELQASNIRVSEGLCVGLLARCAESKFLKFAEELVRFSRARNGMTIAVYSALMKVYAYCGMYDKACDLYDQIRADGLEPDAMMYGCLMKFSVECGRTKLSQELSEKSPSLDIHNYMSLIRAAGRDKDVNRAFGLLARLRDSGVPLDVAAYNCVLDVCVSAGDLKRARELVAEMEKVASLDTITYNTLMKGYCSCGDLKGAKDILSEMQRAGHQPNDVSYNCLVNAAVSYGSGNFQEAWETIELMESNGVAVDHYTIAIVMKALKRVKKPEIVAKALALLDRTGIDICSEEILLNTVLETCIRHKECGRLENIIANYHRCSLRPSVHTFGTLIKACSTLKRIDRCWEFWKEMKDHRGIEPNDIVLGCMIDALVCNDGLEEAVTLFYGWKAKMAPNAVLYSTLIKGFANAHQSDRAMSTWREMRKDGILMNTVVYNALIDAQARMGAMDAVSELVETMDADGCVPDVITYSTIMKGYCVKGNLDKAFEVFRSIQKNDMSRDSVIYNTVLDGCTRYGRFDLADQLLSDMERYKIIPSNFTIGILVKMYGRRRMLDKAFEVVEELPKRFGFAANAQVSTCLINACLNSNAIERALKVFDDMKASGQGPDSKAYRTLINGCVWKGELDKAAALVEEAYGLTPGGEGVAKAKQAVGLEAETVEQLLKAFAHRGLMETKGMVLLERLRSAKVPISGRLVGSACGSAPPWRQGGKAAGKGRSSNR